MAEPAALPLGPVEGGTCPACGEAYDDPSEWARHAPACMEARRRELHARKGTWAAICLFCAHSLSAHLLEKGGDFRAGPYRCACGCGVPQGTDALGLGPSGYVVWTAAYADPRDAA